MALTAREVIYKIIGDPAELIAGFEKTDKAVDEFKRKTESANKVLGDIAKQSALAVGALAALGVAVGKMAADYNADLSQIETLIPGQTERIQELKSAIQELSPEARKTTKDLAEGAYQIISAYGDAPDTMKKLEISAKAASAGAATTMDAINLLSAVTKAYGDTSAAAQRQVADLAFVTVRNGQTTFPELASPIQRVTSLSATLKISQAELFAVFASGTGVIGGAAEVATKTAAAEAELLRGTDTLNAAFKELGVSSGAELIQKFGGFQGALKALRGYADESGVSVTNLFGSVEAGQIALYLTGEGAAKFSRDLSDMKVAAGAMDTAFSASTEGVNKFGDGLTRSRLNAIVFAQRLGDEVLASTQGFLGNLVSVTDALASMDRETLALVVSVAKVVAAALSATAAVAGLTKGIIAAKAAWTLLTGAFSLSFIGPAIVGITVAAAAVMEFAKAAERSRKALIEQTKEVVALSGKGADLAAQYAALQSKGTKTSSEMERMASIMTDLKRLFPDLTEEIIRQAAEQGRLAEVVEKAAEARRKEHAAALDAQYAETASRRRKLLEDIKLQEEQIKYNEAADANGYLLSAALAEAKKEAEELKRRLAELLEARMKLISGPKAAEPGSIAPAAGETVSGAKKSDKSQGERLKELDEEYKTRKALALRNGEDIYAIEREAQSKRLELLQTFVAEDVAARKKNADIAVALTASLGKDLESGYKTLNEELNATRAHLAELTAEKVGINLEARISFLSASGLTTEEALKSIREEAARTAASELEKTKGLSAEQASLNLRLQDRNLSDEASAAIRSRLLAVSKEIASSDSARTEALAVQGEASGRLLEVDLARIGGTAERTEASIDREIELKKQVGLLGSTDEDVKKNSQQEKYNGLVEKQKSLIGEYNSLMATGSDADKRRAEAVKTEIEKLGVTAQNVAKDMEGSFQGFFSKLADKIESIGGKLSETFSSVSNIATGLIGNRAEKEAREYAAKLAKIEQEKNAAVTELEDDLNEMREAHRRENEEAEEEYRERQYEEQQAEYSRSIAELETAMIDETNIEKLRETEKQLEEERKKKREALEAKNKEKEDKKRAEAQQKAENERLNQLAQLEYEYSVAQVETQNAAGIASANAAREQAKWEKASSILGLTLMVAVNIARAASSFPNVPAMVAYGVAAAIAGAQATVAATAPEPAPYTPQPLPTQPKKLAEGAIFLPRSGGTQVTLPSGNPAIVAEAGVPELYLPITTANIEALFRAAGIDPGRSGAASGFNYSPVFQLNFQDTQGLTKDGVIEAIREADRDLLAIVEEAKRTYYLGA